MSIGILSSTSLKLRLISGLVLAPVVLGVIYLGSWLFAFMIGLVACIAIFEWYKLCMPSYGWLCFVLGFLYIAISFSSFAYTRYLIESSYLLTVSLLLTVWASDIGAYFTGKAVGGPKLAPTISPNKTISGLGGAIFFSIAALFICLGYVVSKVSGVDLPGVIYISICGAVIGSVGQAGDLMVSYIKRKAGVKDTGNIIPGHGGILDRIDSLMLVSPLFLCMVLIWIK